MTETVLERLRKSRQASVKIGALEFTVRRPTDEEAFAHFRTETPVTAELLSRFLVNWNLSDKDIVEGGSKDKVPFEAELAREWLADHAEHWPPLLEKITELYQEHAKAREVAPKN